MILLSTSSLKGYGLHKAFQIAKDAGYDGVCLDMDQASFDTCDTEYVLAISQSVWIPVLSVTAFERKMNDAGAEEALEMAKKVGAKTINFFPPHRADKDGTWFETKLPDLAKANPEIEFAVVNVEPKTFLFFIPEYKGATLDSIKKVTGKTTLHVSNVDPESGIDLMKAFAKLGSSICNVLLSDRSGNKEDLLPGRGSAPLESLLIKLRDAGYKGHFTIRVAPKELSVGDSVALFKRLAQAKDYVGKLIPRK